MVARLFAKGQVNKSIAEEIGVSPHTVRNQFKVNICKARGAQQNVVGRSLAISVLTLCTKGYIQVRQSAVV